MLQDNLYKSLTKKFASEKWQKEWFILLLVKVIIAIFLPFFSDEAYYWVWSHNLKLSYFDHPPFISWLFWLGSPFENFHFAARLPVVLIGHLTIWIWCSAIAQKFDSDNKRLLLWILSLHTLIGFGAFVSNPDVPFLFFWSLSILFFLRSIEKTTSFLWPALLGISLGLGFTSKYLLALFVPVAFIYLVLSGKWKILKWHHLVLPIALGAVFSLPVWIWNFNNDWISFKFQMQHGLGKTWHPKWTGDFLLGTLLLLFPPFVYVFIQNRLYRQFKDFNTLLFLVLFFFFVYTTFGGDTELNWPLAIYPSFFFVLVPFLKSKKVYKSFLGFFGTLGSVMILYAFWGPKNTLHPRLTEGLVYKKIFLQSQKYSPLYTSTYQSASYFWFLSKKPYYKLRFSSRTDEYDFMDSSLPQEEVFYFLKEKYQTIPAQHLIRYNFEKLTDLENNFEIYKATKKK